MTNRRLIHCTALVVASWLLVSLPGTASAQDALSRAKGFYESADYEEALQLLESLKGKTANTEAAAYQVFCLVALGRKEEARVAIEAIVRADPLFRPSESQVSPRVRTFFDDVRKPLLPDIARQSYAKAKADFDQRDWAAAQGEFNRVIALLDEIGGSEQGAADLRTLAAGFRDLTHAALAPPPAAAPPPPVPAVPAAPTTVSPPVAPDEPRVYGTEDADVKRPLVVSKPVPAWHPASAAEERMSFVGTMELMISEAGTVLSASLVKSVHPRYDAVLLEAAKAWKFRPATRNGVPVTYRLPVAVQLGR